MGGLQARSTPFLADDLEMCLAFLLRQSEGLIQFGPVKITVILPLVSKGY